MDKTFPLIRPLYILNIIKSEGHLYLPIVFEYYGGMSDDAVNLNAAKCEYENKWVQHFSFQTYLWTTLMNIEA